MNSQFFKDFLEDCREQGMSGKEILEWWRKIKRQENQRLLKEIRHSFCQKFGIDESLSDMEISIELLMRNNDV